LTWAFTLRKWGGAFFRGKLAINTICGKGSMSISTPIHYSLPGGTHGRTLIGHGGLKIRFPNFLLMVLNTLQIHHIS
jgi:hypothetical protein